MRKLKVCSLVFVVLGMYGSSGCSKDANAAESQPGASQGNEAPPGPVTGTVPMTKLTDGQIAKILETVDTGEIEQAQLALKKATNPAVREFASHMVDEHTASKQAGAQLAAGASLDLADSPKAMELQGNGSKMLERLNAADSSNFDLTYIDGQIEEHTAVLKVINDQLTPAVNTPALREFLTNASGMVQRHLDQARQIKK